VSKVGVFDPHCSLVTTHRVGSRCPECGGRGPADDALEESFTTYCTEEELAHFRAFCAKAKLSLSACSRLLWQNTTGVNDPLLRQDQAGFSSIEKYGGHNQSVRFNGAVTSRWLLEGGYARAANDVVEAPFAVVQEQEREASRRSVHGVWRRPALNYTKRAIQVGREFEI